MAKKINALWGEKLIQFVGANKTAIIVLHEIYGINNFITDICHQYHTEGYDVFCPNLYHTKHVFSYSESEEAYRTFIDRVGFDVYKKINVLAARLKKSYSKVVIIGFSVGATIAWRCSEQIGYNGILCCYGSRIRDYFNVQPKCSTLLIFAKYDSFHVDECVFQLQKKENTALQIIQAKHGFADIYSNNYSQAEAELLHHLRKDFFAHCTK